MADIVSIATATPSYAHKQIDILHYMQNAYQLDADEKRKLAFLYNQSGIETRHSVIPDYSTPNTESYFLPKNNEELFPSIDHRMAVYKKNACLLSIEAITNCIEPFIRGLDQNGIVDSNNVDFSVIGLGFMLNSFDY